jgi:hypothetical protein
MSDCFVVAGKFLQLPPGAGPVPDSAISTTSILACYREGQAGCGGGNPAQAAVDIQTKGVFGSSCYDYSWILTNNKFNGDSKQHFDAKDLETALANALPNCGCVVGGDRKKFTLKDVNTLPAMSEQNPDSPEALRNTWDTVRKWIWDNGSVIGGFVVYTNFFAKNFNETDGVYFEDYPYEGRKKDFAGFHAVRIIGWGIQKKCKRPDGNRKDTPYWMVANSWGTDWGDKGYWKMARYPDNPTAQFDVEVIVRDGRIGGFVVFKAGNIFNAKIPQVQAKFQNTVDPKRLEAGFYKSDLQVSSEPASSAEGGNGSQDKPEDKVSTEPKSGSNFLRNLLIGFVVIGIAAAIIYRRRSSTPSQFEYQYKPAPYQPSMRSIRI